MRRLRSRGTNAPSAMMSIDVARMSGAISGKRLPRISLRSCGLRMMKCRAPRAAVTMEMRPWSRDTNAPPAMMSIDVARMSGAISGKRLPRISLHSCGLRMMKCRAPCSAVTMEHASMVPRHQCPPANNVDRCSPDERSDIRERLPRISLRSCGLRLLKCRAPRAAVTIDRAFMVPQHQCPPAIDRCSPDERSDIRERLPRISLRSCALRRAPSILDHLSTPWITAASESSSRLLQTIVARLIR
jgi:hypothetical protein